MGMYEFIDNFSMSIGGAVAKNNKYFSIDVNSIKIKDWFEIIDIHIPQINGEGYYPVMVNYEDKESEAGFRIEQWKGESYPTIIYHHGAAEGSYDLSFNNILAKHKKNINANLIAIQAIFNHNNKEFMESIAYLSNYSLLLASSTLIIENLITYIRSISNEKITVTGTSLGGFVTNLHFTYFNTANIYKPLLAGARLGDVFIDSAYSKVTSNNGKSQPEMLKKVLNFNEDINKVSQENLFPLMGQYDQIIKYDTQVLDFKKEQVKTIPYGHASGATKYKILREHIV